jgi:two-component system sensor histidine kinase QseC
LTAIKTHLQVAQMTEGAVAAQALTHAEAGADRLQQTLEQLLLLARVEGSLSFEDGVHCNAQEVARQAINDACQGDGLRSVLHVPTELATTPLDMPAVLAIAALRNLLDNALRHTAVGTQVELSLHSTASSVRFQVRDHGPGIPADAMPYLTQRFWRQGKSSGCCLTNKTGSRSSSATRPPGARPMRPA